MSRLLSKAEDICKLSLPKSIKLPVQNIRDCILFDAFIVCTGRAIRHWEIAVFNRITMLKNSTMQIEKCARLVRLHNRAVGFCYSERDDNNKEQPAIFSCFFQPFSIDKFGMIVKQAPLFLLSTTICPWDIAILTSLDEQNNEVAAISFCDDVDNKLIYDFSGTNVFPVDSAPTFIVPGKTICLVGRSIWTKQYDHGRSTEVINQYELSTGKLIHTSFLREISFGQTHVYRNRFVIAFSPYSGSFSIYDTVNKVEALQKYDVLQMKCTFARDVTDDGCMIFRDSVMPDNFALYRIDVPSLADIAKECIRRQSMKTPGISSESDPGPPVAKRIRR